MMTKSFVWLALASTLAVQTALAFSPPAMTSRHTTTIRSTIGDYDTYEKGTGPLAFKDVILGAGEGAVEGDVLTVSYRGILMETKRQFADTSDLTFQIGDGKVMPGFEKGIIGAKEGSRRLLRVPPVDAFGASAVGRGGVIPPNSDLEFDIEVTRITRGVQGKLALFGEGRAAGFVACTGLLIFGPNIEIFIKSLL